MSNFDATTYALFLLLAVFGSFNLAMTIATYRRTVKALRAIAIQSEKSHRAGERRASADQSAVTNRFIVVDKRLADMASAVELLAKDTADVMAMAGDKFDLMETEFSSARRAHKENMAALTDRIAALETGLSERMLSVEQYQDRLNTLQEKLRMRMEKRSDGHDGAAKEIKKTLAEAEVRHKQLTERTEKRSDALAQTLKEMRQQVEANWDQSESARAHMQKRLDQQFAMNRETFERIDEIKEAAARDRSFWSKRLDQGLTTSQKLIGRVDQLKQTGIDDRNFWQKRLTGLDERLKALSERVENIADDRSREAFRKKQEEARIEIAALKSSLSASVAQKDMLRARLKEAHAGAKFAQRELMLVRSKEGDAEEAAAFSRSRNGGGSQ